jgi:Cu/Zn superoxide dismutase
VTSNEVAKQDSASATTEEKKSDSQPVAQATTTTNQSSTAKPSTDSASNSKLMLGDMELRATEAVSGEGTRQSDSKYFHIYQNGACYEFALNVTTDASADGLVKHVDRDKVFNRLEQILATVKINPVAAPEVTAEAPTPVAPSEAPAQ